MTLAPITELLVSQDGHPKTLDIGSDGHTISCNATGDILQLGCFHPVQGMIVACPFAQFDGTRFHDPEYVRAYRKKLLDYVRDGTRGMGIRLDGDAINVRASFLANQWISISYSIGFVDVSATISINKHGVVEQAVVLNSRSDTAVSLGYSLDLQLSLNRASYGQLTEGGPIPIPDSKNDFRISESGYAWSVWNENLGAVAYGGLYCNGKPLCIGSQLCDGVYLGEPVRKTVRGSVDIFPGTSCTLTSTFGLQPADVATTKTLPYMLSTPQPIGSKGNWKLKNDELGLIIQRNLEYILGNCTFSVGNDAVCFITDHVALPLGWNRDNYWQIRYLLDVHRHIDKIAHPSTASSYATQISKSVKGHLKWVFDVAERPLGYWHRSYLMNGKPKDGPVFQQDQQCYPILELCDFCEEFPSERVFAQEILAQNTIPLILEMLEKHRDPGTGLYMTEETPGDDAVEHPFHFSSHILLWHTINRLSSLVRSFPELPSAQYASLESQASSLRNVILKHFIGEHPRTGKSMFAYLTDGAGTQTFYHDANDIPTLFALDWNFIDDSLQGVWRNTIDFALSPLNDGGFYPKGKFGGLGSVHTRGPWPLGFAQEFIFAGLTENMAAKEDAWRRIKGSMSWDGLFPEAVDSDTGECVSKAWFSWPGSMIGSALLRFDI